MAFNPQEQAIIEFGVKNGKSKEEVTRALTNLRLGITPEKVPQQNQPAPSFLEGLKADLNTRVGRVSDIQSRPDTSVTEKGVQTFGQGAGLVASTIEKTAEQIPGVKEAVGAIGSGIEWLSKSKPIQAIGNKIGSNLFLQEATQLYDTDPNFRDTLDAVANTVRLGADVQAVGDLAKTTRSVFDKLTNKVANKTVTDSIASARQVMTNLTPDRINSLGGEKALIEQTQKDIVMQLQSQNLGSVADKIAKIDLSKVSSVDDFAKLSQSTIKGSLTDLIPGIGKKIPEKMTKNVESILKPAREVVRDLTPTKEAVRDRTFASAFKLAPVDDLARIEQLTGNKPAAWVDKYQLYRNTPADTATEIAKFKKRNINAVDDAIALIPDNFTFADLPELKTITGYLKKDLSQLKSAPYKQVLDRINTIEKKGSFDLSDAQYIKKAFDDIESIYKRTGDVKEKIIAQDMANNIAPVRRFIEDRVKAVYPEIDINSLNNNVQTASAILDAIVKRAPKAETASLFQLGDMAVIGVGNQIAPGTGFAALFGKKIIESAPIQLRIAKWISGKTKDLTNGMSLEQIKTTEKMLQSELKSAIDEPTINRLETGLKEVQSKLSQPQRKVSKVPLPKSSPKSTTKSSLKGKGVIPETNLINKAKKYKSAEEFVKAQQPITHYTAKKFNKFDLSKTEAGSVWFTDNPKIDLKTGQGLGSSQVGTGGAKYKMDRYVNPKSKIIDIEKSDLTDKYTTGQLIDMGYSGVKVPQLDGSNWYEIWEPNKDLLTKSQLIEIWKKVNKK